MQLKRYKDFTNESKAELLKEFPEFWWLDETKVKDKAKKIANILQRDCAKFIDEIQGSGSFVFRGTDKEVNSLIQSFGVRTDREPKAVSKRNSVLFDDLMEKKFGIRPRSEGVFGTSDEGVATSYGRPYMLFPIGNYKYVWSDEIFDLYGDSMYIDDEPESEQDRIIEYFTSLYKDTDLKGAIKSGNEITFICDKYYLVKPVLERELIKLLFGK